jgi:hypothetical protein
MHRSIFSASKAGKMKHHGVGGIKSQDLREQAPLSSAVYNIRFTATSSAKMMSHQLNDMN